MLEREGNDVLDSLHGYGQRIPRESFTYDDLDPAQVICGTPVVLSKKFAAKGRKLEVLQFAVFCEVWDAYQPNYFRGKGGEGQGQRGRAYQSYG